LSRIAEFGKCVVFDIQGLLSKVRLRAHDLVEDAREHRWAVAIVGVLIVGVLGAAVAGWPGSTSTSASTEGQPSTRADADEVPSTDGRRAQVSSTTTVAAAATVVQVAGAVMSPGLYSLTAGARVDDAVRAAGGLAAEAAADQLNLAAKVVDGQRLYVPRSGEATPPATGSSAGAASNPPSGLSSTAGASGSSSVMVDINSATAEQLDELPGVGPTTAEAIVEYRTANGPFRSVEDLANVKGIGPAKLARIRPHATV
jgi:competence protein ComEA